MSDKIELMTEVCSALQYDQDQYGGTDWFIPLTRVRYTNNKCETFEILWNGKVYEIHATFKRMPTADEIEEWGLDEDK